MKIYKCVKQSMPIPEAKMLVLQNKGNMPDSLSRPKMCIATQSLTAQYFRFSAKRIGKSLRWTAYLYLFSSNFCERTFFQMYPTVSETD